MLLLLLIIPLLISFARQRRLSVAAIRTLQLGVYVLMSVLFLPANAFSSNRWNGIPLQCPAVEDGEEDGDVLLQWCAAITALRVFVWLLWVACEFHRLVPAAGWLIGVMESLAALLLRIAPRRTTRGRFLSSSGTCIAIVRSRWLEGSACFRGRRQIRSEAEQLLIIYLLYH